jgi:hypothetical protein
MKRLTVLALLLVLVIAACSKESSESSKMKELGEGTLEYHNIGPRTFILDKDYCFVRIGENGPWFSIDNPILFHEVELAGKAATEPPETLPPKWVKKTLAEWEAACAADAAGR